MKNIFTTLFLFVAFQSVGQTTLYVSPTGNDNLTVAQNSINTPWRTLQKACDSAPAGSTVYFRGGVYPSKSVIMNVSGTAGNYIKFKNYAQEVPVIDGGDIYQTLLQITNRAYLIIDGLHFKNVTTSGSRGVMIEGNSHHIEIRNCKISEINVSDSPTYIPASCDENVSPLKVCGGDNAQAINNIIIANNEVFSCKTGCSEGIAVSGNVDGFLIEKNSVHDIANIGIVAAGFYSSCGSGQARNGTIRGNVVYNCRFPNPAINTTASGIYLDGAKNMIVEQNRVYFCQVGIHVGCETAGQIADNNTVRNNIVYNNEKWGIGMGGNNGFVENSRLINNTLFYNNYFYNGFYGDFGEVLLQKVRNSTVSNNICYIRYQASNAVFMKWDYPASISNITINHNTYFTPDACSSALIFVRNGLTNLNYSAYQALGYDVNGNTLNPQFINPSLPHPDLHLQLSSPLINAANNALSSVAGSVDFDGNTRQVTSLDRGAYEYQPCPSFYNLFGTSPAGSLQYKASQAITSVGEVPLTANTAYQAAQFVELKPNFEVEKGAVFTAQIAGCGNNWVEMFNEDFNPCSNLSDKWQVANRKDYNSTICNYLPSIPQIASFDNKSCLQITAQKIGNTNEYQSGHCKSSFSFKPAVNEEYHVSASIKLIAIDNGTYRGFAQTYGAWPAFWTVNEMGTNWPTKGEIDIVEAYSFGNPNNVNYASDIHYGVTSGMNQVNAKVSYNTLGEGWHTYEQFWRNQNGTISVTIKVDGLTKAVYTNATVPNLQLQNFDAHTIILNLNVGSTNAPIFINANINLFSQTMMYVDYVKVRKRAL